ncbi:EamA family transporter [Pseudomonas sp. FP215]|nr:EamA family transporter [Pseudomonas sp. FP215]WLH27207.1 EamA family transporter [Pseudomonas sp. FP215]
MSSSSLSKSGSWFDMQTLTVLFSAFALYGLTTILWVYVLQRADLGKIYPLMALAFVIVPIGSHFVFGERFQPQYMVGVALIIVGIVVTVKA